MATAKVEEVADTKVSLKLLVDKKANKVLFAEAGKDFVDFLFNLLSLPVSTVIRLITNSTMVGCIGNLYESIEHLNENYMQPNQSKDVLLKPSFPNHVTKLALLLPDTALPARKFYVCANSSSHRYVTDSLNAPCPHCKYSMSSEVQFTTNMNTTETTATSGGGFVKELVTYMVTDDLSVSPMSMISGVTLLNKFNVKDFSLLDEKVVDFGMDEAVELLKASLQSKAALTAVFLMKKKQGMKEDASANLH